jgi:hypothetical protein
MEKAEEGGRTTTQSGAARSCTTCSLCIASASARRLETAKMAAGHHESSAPFAPATGGTNGIACRVDGTGSQLGPTRSIAPAARAQGGGEGGPSIQLRVCCSTAFDMYSITSCRTGPHRKPNACVPGASDFGTPCARVRA